VTAITVRKHNWQGVFRYAWHGELLSREPGHLVLRAIWNGPGEPQVEDLRFVHGDQFIEHYYPGRGYAIWQIEGADGTLKGWYCNISTPVEEQSSVLSFDDLLLDVLVYPDGRWKVLDLDEFETARHEGLSPERALLAEQALDEVLALISQEASPFYFTSEAPRSQRPTS
jgi:hypothetical protein